MKVLLGLSGGLDSTYSVVLLQNMGYEVAGAVLQMHDCAPVSEARQSAQELGIDLLEIDCRDQFEKKVISNFTSEYYSGRTPNPCIICNPEVKFAVLLENAKKLGYDKIATGHYAKIGHENKDGKERYFVFRSPDSKKDQSYMLYRLGQETLSALLLPLGDSTKETVRKEANERKMSSADRPESQEICFIPDGDYASYLIKRQGKVPSGNFIDKNGTVLGRHKGIIHYTVGQRRGLGIATGERMFIVEIRPETNEIVLAPASEGHGVTTIIAEKPIWGRMAESDLPCRIECEAVVRYHAKTIPCIADLTKESLRVVLSEKQNATPGQSVVLYDKDGAVLAGGIIVKTFE